MALANIAQNIDPKYAGPLMSSDFIDRVIKLAVMKDIELHVEISTLLRNLSFYPQFAELLRDRGAIVAIAYLRKSVFPQVRDSGQIAAQNLMGNSTDSTRVDRQAAILASFEPLVALVNWDTWGSKLDSIFSPVFAAAPQAIGRHVVSIIGTERKILLKGEDSQGRQLVFKIRQQPSHGTLSEIRSDGTVTYLPDEGFVGDDYFTYVARNNYMESNVATVAIKIRNDNDIQQAAMAMEALLSEKSITGAMIPALNVMGETFTKQLALAKERSGAYLFGRSGGSAGGGDVGGEGSWGWGTGVIGRMFRSGTEVEEVGAQTKYDELMGAHQVTGSAKLTQTRAELRTAKQKAVDGGS